TSDRPTAFTDRGGLRETAATTVGLLSYIGTPESVDPSRRWTKTQWIALLTGRAGFYTGVLWAQATVDLAQYQGTRILPDYSFTGIMVSSGNHTVHDAKITADLEAVFSFLYQGGDVRKDPRFAEGEPTVSEGSVATAPSLRPAPSSGPSI